MDVQNKLLLVAVGTLAIFGLLSLSVLVCVKVVHKLVKKDVDKLYKGK